MLVETMTSKEIMEEIRKDFKQLNELTRRFIENGGVRHLRRQGSKFPAYVIKVQRTSRGNRYICDFLFKRRDDVFKNNGMETRMALMETKEGLAGITVVYNGKYEQEILHLYRPHVFKRYKERMGLDLEGVELIKYFDKRNSDTILHDNYRHKEGDIENDIMLTCQDGALFGTKSEADGCICYTINTFIANDTMQDGYKAQFNNMHNQAIEQIKEEDELFGRDAMYQFNYTQRKEDPARSE